MSKEQASSSRAKQEHSDKPVNERNDSAIALAIIGGIVTIVSAAIAVVPSMVGEDGVFPRGSEDVFAAEQSIPVNFGNTFLYNPNAEKWTLTASDGRKIKSGRCKSTWHSIVYTDDKLLFYDQDAGAIQVYEINSHGLGKQLKNHPGGFRKTWTEITSPVEGVITFREGVDVEHYRLNDDGTFSGYP